MNFSTFDYYLLLRLVAAVIFGSLIGFERGRRNHEAGLRTHIILCLGSAAVMVVSECLVKDYGGDMMRLGAQVISGVGFLGAGSIILTGNRVKGITTAAGLWTTACVGIAVGCGYYIIAGAVVLLMLIAMWGMHSLSARLESNSLKYIVKVNANSRYALKEILQALAKEGADAVSVRLEGEGDAVSFILEIKLQRRESWDSLIGKFAVIEGVKGFVTM